MPQPISDLASKQDSQLQPVSSFNIFRDIFISPTQAFKAMQYQYPLTLPLLTIIMVNALLIVLLFANIDYAWYIEHMVEIQAGELSNAEQSQSRAVLSIMSAAGMGMVEALSVALFMSVVLCILALYFVMVSSVRNDGFQFKQWLCFICWTSMPSLLGLFASIVMIFSSSDGQIAHETLNPLSLNSLFFGLDAIEGIGSILASTDISIFWSIALMTIGYSRWTETSYGKSLIIVSAPYITYYAVYFITL